MDDFFDLGLFEDFGEELEVTSSLVIPEDEVAPYYERSKAYWMQVPIPSELAPTGGAPLAALDDETLMSMSPTLLVHAQRTAASAGVQVISPRTVPLAACAARTMERHRSSDMFVVGSNASTNLDWPVVREPISHQLIAYEPIDAYPYVPSLRPKTRTTSVVTAAEREANPIVRALLIGRALVDLQRRPDVAGSGDALAKHIASAWGVQPDVYEALGQATLAPQGPLLRYAARADAAYPILNAPIHLRKCISVGANSTGREVFGEDAAVDWRRIRVLAEATYYMASRLEGHTLAQMSLAQPPGDPRADPTRPGVIQMRPMPGSVWSHASATFRLDISDVSPVTQAVCLPDQIRAAVDSFIDSARPIALAAMDPSKMDLVPTASRRVTSATSETIVTGYKTLMIQAMNYSSRGKTSVAAIRDFMYQYLSGTPTLANIRSTWMARYLSETAKQAGLTHLIDNVMVRQLASRFSDAALDMRVKLATEAVKRGSDLETWWADVVSLLPSELSGLKEGSASWAIATSRFLLFPYSHKWAGLSRALAITSHRSLAESHLKSIRLPATLRSQQRVLEAAQATCKSLASSYGAYYAAMFDVGRMLSAQMRRCGMTIAADKLNLAALMWDIRAKTAATADLRVALPGEIGTLGKRTGPYILTTAPHSAYARFRSEALESKSVSRTVKLALPHHVDGHVSNIFGNLNGPIAMGQALGATRMFRYYSSPSDLGHDMEHTLRMMHDDIESVIAAYELEELPADVDTPVATRITEWSYDFMNLAPPADSYWMTLTQLDQLEAVEIEDQVNALDPATAAGIMADSYHDADDLLRRVSAAIESQISMKESRKDTVI